MDQRKRMAVAGLVVALVAGPYLPGAASAPGPSQQTPAPSPSPDPSPSASTSEPSPSPSETPDAPAPIRLLNPSPAFGSATTFPVVSDLSDGHDEAFHMLAYVDDPPPYAIVEAAFTSWSHPLPPSSPPNPVPNPVPTSRGNESEIGLMSPVPGSPNVFELFWDVPETLPNGTGTVTARIYDLTRDGPQELGAHSVDVRLQHQEPSEENDNTAPAATAELAWPARTAGKLGFYRSKTTSLGGNTQNVWASAVDGTASTGSLELRYTVDPLTGPLEFTSCEFASADQSGRFEGMCDLGGLDLPSQVTAVAVVPASGAADVHVVEPYVQNVEKMDLSLVASPSARALPHECVEFVATVEDHLGRLVPNVNVDIDAKGPNDDSGFGAGDSLPLVGAPQPTPPDAGAHATQLQRQCGSTETSASQRQGYHRAPGRPDTKHIEFATGTSGTGLGRLAFSVYSPIKGTADVTAWIDDFPLRSDTVSRLEDDDQQAEGEPAARGRAYWYDEGLEILLDQERDAAAPGECLPLTVKVRGDTTPVVGINVDVHVSSEGGHAGFCDPSDGPSARRAADEGPHDGESHAGAERPTRHIEGETDSLGNLLFGVTSSQAGTSEVVAWVDGEPEAGPGSGDDDVLAEGENSIQAGQSWGTAAEDAHVALLSPSSIGTAEAPIVSSGRDADTTYTLVARVDAPQLVPSVELSVAPAGSRSFGAIGSAARIGESDVYSLEWDASGTVPGGFVVRASIPGTERSDEIAVEVDNTRQSVAISSPLNGGAAAFDKRVAVVDGLASLDVAGVDLYYTTRAGAATDAPRWEECGTVAFSSPDDPRSFSGKCALSGKDRPYQVVGLAAVAAYHDCAPTGCTRRVDSGDVARVYGIVAQPAVTLEPYRHEAEAGQCRRMVMEVADERGELLSGIPVDVALTGPGESSAFCDPGEEPPAPPPAGTSAPRAGDGSVHLEGHTTAAGVFEFGVVSTASGDSDVVAWVDEAEDDVHADGEPYDTAIIHWVLDDDCTAVGTSGPDTLVGGPGPDKLCGRGGDDVLRGAGGDDVLVGGRGRDSLAGGGGRDLLHGNASRDTLDGGPGDDVCLGGGAKDRIRNCEDGDGYSGKPPV